ncbi:MAG TPA: helix-turn-helix transcriptional regulator [Phycisphaerales bacterium]|nr:helix-turn-helix transcriptional regulator [Phycisphaerales bacterium]
MNRHIALETPPAANGHSRTAPPAQPDSHRVFVANRDEERQRRQVLAGRLREAVAGISCARLAQRTGWSAETVRRYLQGRAAPPATLLMVLAEEVGANPDYLLLGRGPVHLESSLTGPRQVPNRQIVDALYFLIAQHEGNGSPSSHRNGHLRHPPPLRRR